MRKKRGPFSFTSGSWLPARAWNNRIIRVLGSGGFGITYLAKDLFLNRNVVIKENFLQDTPTGTSDRAYPAQ